KQELHLLKDILDKLRAEKLIQERVTVTGQGRWSVVGTGPFAGKPTSFAAGGRVPGYGGGDRWPALLEGGEAGVGKQLAAAPAAAHAAELRTWGVPGFAAGGIVPAYQGPVAGLPPWTSHNQAATVTAIAEGIARAFASMGGGFGGHGVIPQGPVQSYARRLVGSIWPGMGEWLAFADIVRRESNWNTFAVNPQSGAYGLPQALPGSKMAAAGADWRTNPYTQLRWMAGYIRSRWGDPIGA